jgi:translation elongation factor EF-Tu-like GTPase
MGARPHFRAHVRVRSKDEGGRRGALDLSRYRPDLSFAVDNTVYYGGQPTSEAEGEDLPNAWIAPGEEFDADFQIRFAASQIMSRLEVGSQFRMMEGHHPTGDGAVTRIYRTDD